MPTVVADHHLEAGNALLNLSQQGGMVLGPAVAGVLIATAPRRAAQESGAAVSRAVRSL